MFAVIPEFYKRSLLLCLEKPLFTTFVPKIKHDSG